MEERDHVIAAVHVASESTGHYSEQNCVQTCIYQYSDPWTKQKPTFRLRKTLFYMLQLFLFSKLSPG